MRIAVVASPVTPLRAAQLGGAQAFVCDLALGLIQRGHDVTLHCAEGSDVPGVRLATVPAPRDAAAALVMPGASAPPRPAPGVAAVLAAVSAVDAKRLATVSRSCREQWERAGVVIGRLLLNGVPTGPRADDRVDRVALVAGRISPEKGIEDAIAAARAAGLPVRLVGAHYDPAYEVDVRGV